MTRAHMCTLTFPLTEESVTHHSKLVPEKYKLASSQCFGEYVCNLLLCRYALYLHSSSLNIVMDEVIMNIDMLRPVMKKWILREFDATLIITVNHGRPQLHTEQSHQ
jgi:hypothetical protein